MNESRQQFFFSHIVFGVMNFFFHISLEYLMLKAASVEEGKKPLARQDYHLYRVEIAAVTAKYRVQQKKTEKEWKEEKKMNTHFKTQKIVYMQLAEIHQD